MLKNRSLFNPDHGEAPTTQVPPEMRVWYRSGGVTPTKGRRVFPLGASSIGRPHPVLPSFCVFRVVFCVFHVVFRVFSVVFCFFSVVFCVFRVVYRVVFCVFRVVFCVFSVLLLVFFCRFPDL